MRIKEVYDIAMPASKRKEERMNIWVTAAVRPLSVILTAPFVNTKIKPTSITAVSILFSVVGSVFFSLGANMLFGLIGWACFFVWAVLDGVDGNLARCQKSCSAMGDLWDTMGGYAAMVLMYFSAGIAAYYTDNLYEFCDPAFMLMAGGATAVISIFPRLVMHKKKSSSGNSDAVKKVSDKTSFSFSKIMAMNLVSPSGFMQVILLLSLIFKVLNFFIVFYLIVNFGIMMISLRSLLREE